MGRILRTLLTIIIVLVVIILVAGVAIYVNSQRVLAQRFDNPVQEVSIPRTAEQVERGRYLVASMPGCVACHSSNPTANVPILDGNTFEVGPIATLHAPNLTPGGTIRDWSDGEIIRAIREGVRRDGRGLIVMPSENYRNLSDADVQAIVAYLRSQPAVQKDSPPPSLKPLGIILSGLGQFSTTRQEPVRNVTAPPRGPNAAYGRYLVMTSGCQGCHGANLDGAQTAAGPPPGPNLRVVKGWTEAQFIRTMREGINPSDHRLSEEMPWREIGRATDDDLRALYSYVREMP